MALVTTTSVRRGSRPEESLRRFAAYGREWLIRAGFPPEVVEVEDYAVEAGYTTSLLGEHNPDLIVSLCERVGLPYKTTRTTTVREGVTYVRRNITVNAEPEPEPVEADTPTREYGKGRSVRLAVRVSEIENEQVTEAANAAGVSVSDYIRTIISRSVNADRAWRGEPVDRDFLDWANAKVEALKRRGPLRARRA